MSFDILTPPNWQRSSVSKYCHVQLGKMLQSEPSGVDDELLPYLRAISISKSGVDLSHQFTMWIKPHEKEKFRLKRDDVLVSEGGDAGRTAHLDVDGEYYFQNAINRVRPIDTEQIFSRYLYYWFTFLKIAGYVELICNVATIAHFTAEKVKAAPFAFPSLDTQKRIAAFLDEKTAQIDALIEKKQALLERLAEKRQAIITQAVTKGLNPAAPMKPSGIEWLRDIPAHWEKGNIRRFATMKTGHTPSRTVSDYWINCTIPWFTLSDVWQLRDGTRLYIEETSEKISELGLAGSAAELLPAGTVIFSRTASIGFSGIMPYPMATTQDFWNWICGPKIIPEYLLFLFRAMQQKFAEITNGSTHKTIYQPIAAGLEICVPPIDHQNSICAHIRSEIGKFDSVSQKIGKAIDQLAEYRAALITAAVTGQMEI
jgi:type I restriction enzyme S subunit